MRRRTKISDVASSLWRYLRHPEVSIRSSMAFVIRFDDAKTPEFELGPRGSELSCYVPPGVSWKQINYGQGEGQVEIGGLEWGFYWQGEGDFAVVLHGGEIDAAEALRFVHTVAEKLSRAQFGFQILLAGYSYRET